MQLPADATKNVIEKTSGPPARLNMLGRGVPSLVYKNRSRSLQPTAVPIHMARHHHADIEGPVPPSNLFIAASHGGSNRTAPERGALQLHHGMRRERGDCSGEHA